MVTTRRRKRPALTPAERFWAKVHPEPNTGCWLWAGNVSENGYGRVWDNALGGLEKAHRVAWVLTHGPVPDGLRVGRRCLLRACVNPAHLYLGTPLDVMDTTLLKGRDRRAHGAAHGSAVMLTAQVVEARRRWAEGERISHLAREYGVRPESMAGLVHGRTWKHLPVTDRQKSK